MTWARCVLDWGWHAIDDHRDHPPGVLEAECSRLLPMVALHDEPAGQTCSPEPGRGWLLIPLTGSASSPPPQLTTSTAQKLRGRRG